MVRPRHLVCLLALLCAFSFSALSLQKNLSPTGYVDDFAGVLNSQTRQQVIDICAEVDHKAGAQIAVVTVASLDGRPIEDFSVDLATKWGVGPKGKSRGILILLAPAEHQYRFEVGYGLEGILPDGKVGGFGREAVPFLKAGNYNGAVSLMTRRVAETIAAARGVPPPSLSALPSAPPPPPPHTPQRFSPFSLLPILFWIVVAIFVLRAVFGRGRGAGCWWPWMFMGGGGGGRGGWMGSGGGGWGGGGGFGGGGRGFGGVGGGWFWGGGGEGVGGGGGGVGGRGRGVGELVRAWGINKKVLFRK